MRSAPKRTHSNAGPGGGSTLLSGVLESFRAARRRSRTALEAKCCPVRDVATVLEWQLDAVRKSSPMPVLREQDQVAAASDRGLTTRRAFGGGEAAASRRWRTRRREIMPVIFGHVVLARFFARPRRPAGPRRRCPAGAGVGTCRARGPRLDASADGSLTGRSVRDPAEPSARRAPRQILLQRRSQRAH